MKKQCGSRCIFYHRVCNGMKMLKDAVFRGDLRSQQRLRIIMLSHIVSHLLCWVYWATPGSSLVAS